MTTSSGHAARASASRDGASELAPALAVLRVLSESLRAAPLELPVEVPSLAAAGARLASGVPALAGEPLLCWDTLLRNAATVARALAATVAGTAVATILDCLDAGALGPPAGGASPGDLTAAVLAGVWDPVVELAEARELDPDALVTVLDYAARPALAAGAAALAPLLVDAAWTRGHCPACGALPVLSVMQGKAHERRLHCARCGSSWAFERVRCSACGERDHERLLYLHAEGEAEFRRAEVCERCRHYVKTVALLDPPDALRVLELDLETAPLDFLAIDAGYTRPPP